MRIGRLPILPERPSVGAMKPLSSANVSFEKQVNGQIIMKIEHDTVRGVTPQMLRWWFENLSEPMQYEGKPYARYLLWHPRDHIHWALVRRSPDGGTGQGAYFRIVEAFAANPAFYVDSVEHVEKLDDEGISLVRQGCWRGKLSFEDGRWS
jgi:DAPG hydrolase PhiG domain